MGLLAKRQDMIPLVLNVNVMWDPEARVFVASSDDIPGLVTEAPTYERLVERVMAVAPELLRDNCDHSFDDGATVAFLQSPHYTSIHAH